MAPFFPLGEVVSTPSALEAMQAATVSPSALLHSHLRGDWGNLDKYDKQLNDLAIKDGSRIFSAYPSLSSGSKLRDILQKVIVQTAD